MDRSMLRVPRPEPHTAVPAAPILQRRCSCGGTISSGGECEACRARRLARDRDRDRLSSPERAHVDRALRAPGTPLDEMTRRFMEPRFGHDFSAVRVHADAAAAASARASAADAYTVGPHIVFGADRYVPDSSAGRRLLAHELAHVVQQSAPSAPAAMQRASIGVLPRAVEQDREDDTLEREAEEAGDAVARGGKARIPASRGRPFQRAAIKRQPAIVGLDEAGPTADLTGRTEDALLACAKNAGANPPACSPARALTWSDFAGAPRRSAFDAETHSTVVDLPMDPTYAACLQRILGKSKDETRIFQGVLDSGRSWVKPQFANAANPAVNGCAALTRECTRHFAGLAARRQTGGTYSLNTAPNVRCPAVAPPSPATATNTGACKTVVEAACTAAAVVESARLLRHEQGHLNISCVIARKANDALATGATLSAIRASARKKLAETQSKYDNQSNHGCIAAQQAGWETDIAAALPTIHIP